MMKKYNIGDLILRINPNAKAIINGDDIDTCTIEWMDGTNPIAIQDIKNIVSTYETEIEEKEKQVDKLINKYKLDTNNDR